MLDSFKLDVGSGHKIHVETYGNPNGTPIIYLHGGPGAGIKPKFADRVDLEKFYFIQFDQRGCGQSEYTDLLIDNDTPHLVQDIEAIRKHLSIEKWAVRGGSWGSTLALNYLAAHSDVIDHVFLRACLTNSQVERDWLKRDARLFYPDYYEAFVKNLPPEIVDDTETLVEYFHAKINVENDEAVARQLAADFFNYDLAMLEFVTEDAPVVMPETVDMKFAYIYFHYFHNRHFFDEAELYQKLEAIDTPVSIVQGRYDMVTPPWTAHRLHKTLKNSSLEFVTMAGHKLGDGELFKRCYEVCSEYADSELS